MDPLRQVSDELQDLQGAVASLDTTIHEIETRLPPLRENSKAMISKILRILGGTLESISDQEKRVQKIGYEIGQVKNRIRELTARSKAVGVQELLAKQKSILARLQHTCQDLQSDVEAIKHFHVNFEGRLNRLDSGA